MRGEGTTREFIKFNIIGFMNTIIDFIVYFLLLRISIGYRLAAIISYIAGVINSYFWNRSWTFKLNKQVSKEEIIKFSLVNLGCMCISLLGLESLHHLGFDKTTLQRFIGKGFSALLPAVFNFLGNKKWVFRK